MKLCPKCGCWLVRSFEEEHDYRGPDKPLGKSYYIMGHCFNCMELVSETIDFHTHISDENLVIIPDCYLNNRLLKRKIRIINRVTKEVVVFT